MSSEHSVELEEITDDRLAREFYMKKIVTPKICGEVICGIIGITKLYYRKAKSNESFGGFPLRPEIAARIKERPATAEEEWIIDTDGTNLSEILAQPGVDTMRTISNDMWEIANIFGVEAARQFLFAEFMHVITSGGSSINPIHIQTLVAKMTYTGGIRAIARFGVETAQYDPISRATFEEVMSQLITSAMFSEKDRLKGISSNIVLGTKISAGTGLVEFENIQLNVVKSPAESKRGSQQHSPPPTDLEESTRKIRPPKQKILPADPIEYEEI